MSDGPAIGPSDDRAFIDRSIRIGIVTVTLVAVLFALLFVLQGALTPLAVSLIIAYFLDPIVRWLERHGIRRRLGVLALMLIAIGLPGYIAHQRNQCGSLAVSAHQASSSASQ